MEEYVLFPSKTGVVKKLLKMTRNNNKKHNKIAMFAKSKLSNIETLIFQALIDIEINHEEFTTIINEKMKESIRNIKSCDEKDELSENNKIVSKNNENV